VKAGRNSFRAFSRALRGGGEHCNSSDLGGRRCGGVTFASSHLEKIEYLWKLARVQVQVLKIQLNNRLTPLETSRLFADDVIGRAAASSSCSASLNLDLKDIGEDIAPLASSPEKCLRIGMTHMPKDSSIAGSYDSGIDRCTTSSNLDASSSAKDDGYFTRWGGGDEMWLNDDEAVAAEIDAALQVCYSVDVITSSSVSRKTISSKIKNLTLRIRWHLRISFVGRFPYCLHYKNGLTFFLKRGCRTSENYSFSMWLFDDLRTTAISQKLKSDEMVKILRLYKSSGLFVDVRQL